MSITEVPVVKTTETAPPLEIVIPETPLEAQILETAADILETEGWCQATWSAWGRRCAVGGIGAAVNRMTFPRGKKAAARRAAERMLAEAVDPEGFSESDAPFWVRHVVQIWNDSSTRTRHEVVQKMREVAARLTPRP